MSVSMQLIKSKVPGEYARIAVVVLMSLATAGMYTALVATGYWESVVNILISAGGVYAFIIQRFENKSPAPDVLDLTS